MTDSMSSSAAGLATATEAPSSTITSPQTEAPLSSSPPAPATAVPVATTPAATPAVAEEPVALRRTAWTGQPDCFVITLQYRMPVSCVTLIFRTNEPVSVDIAAHGDGNHITIHSLNEISLLPVYDCDAVFRDLLQTLSLRPQECTLGLWVPKSFMPTSLLDHVDHMFGMAICKWPFHRISTWQNWWYVRQVRVDTGDSDHDDDDDHHHHHHHRIMVDDVHGPVQDYASTHSTQRTTVKSVFDHMVKTGRMSLGAMCKARARRLRLGRATDQALGGLPPEVAAEVVEALR